METSICSFSIFDLNLARRRLKDALDQGILSTEEAGVAVVILDEMIAVIEYGLPTELRPAESARPPS